MGSADENLTDEIFLTQKEERGEEEGRKGRGREKGERGEERKRERERRERGE